MNVPGNSFLNTYFLCAINDIITFDRGNINFNWLPNIVVKRNAQVRTFVVSILREGIEAGTNARKPGPKSATNFCWHKNCTKHANNELKIGPYVANWVFSKRI